MEAGANQSWKLGVHESEDSEIEEGILASKESCATGNFHQ